MARSIHILPFLLISISTHLCTVHRRRASLFLFSPSLVLLSVTIRLLTRRVPVTPTSFLYTHHPSMIRVWTAGKHTCSQLCLHNSRICASHVCIVHVMRVSSMHALWWPVDVRWWRHGTRRKCLLLLLLHQGGALQSTLQYSRWERDHIYRTQCLPAL